MQTTINVPRSSTAASVDVLEYDSTESIATTGGMAMSKAKRDGRNPSTGARGSRRYGQTITFLTDLMPISTGTNENLY